MYGPPRSRPHATCAFFPSPGLSEMSPDAPARTAKIGWIGRFPLITNARSRITTGVGIVASDFLSSRHNSLPISGSYPRAYCDAFVTISVRLALCHTVGVLHDGISSRGVDQSRE